MSMSSAHYRPLDDGRKQRRASPSLWNRSSTMRRFLVFAMFICLVVYLMWCALTMTQSDRDSTEEPSSAGNSQALAHNNLPSRALTITTTNATVNSADSTTQHNTTSQPRKEHLGVVPHNIVYIAPLLLSQLQSSLSHGAGVAALSLRKTETVALHPPQSNITNSKLINETLVVCSELFADARLYVQNKPRRSYDALPVIYFVTPTYPRREQIAELTRLAYTLLHVPRLHWILANDFGACNVYLDYILNKFGIPYTHLASPMPDFYRKKKPLPRGVANRRAAIQWLRQRNITNGVLYFGDDDNTYDLKLFSDIRDTQRVSMFPVGLIEEYSISGPVVRQGKVIGFLDSWVADRRWPVDMAGFAVNLAYMAEHPNATMPYKPGYEEDYFLRSIGLRLDLIEPKGNNCTEILVWHTQTKNHNPTVIRIGHEYLDDRSNLGALFKTLEIMGVAAASNTEGHKAIISKNGKAKPLSYFLS